MLLLILMPVLLWFWLDGARAREIATELAKTFCQRQSEQFLDGTVVLRKMRLCQAKNGKRIARTFSFDYADEDGLRRQGYVMMCGRDVKDISLGLYIAE